MNRSFTEQWYWIAGWLLLLFTGLSLSSCQMAHMVLPQSLQSEASELTVEGRQFSLDESFHFGPYHVTNVHRGWTSTNSISMSGYSASEAKQQYEFSVDELDRTAWEVQCATGVNWSQLELQDFLGGVLTIGSSPDRQLACTLKQQDGERLSKLVMAQSDSETALQGIMTDGATQIDISATHKLATSPFPLREPTGYMFHIEDRLVGAVEIINKGTVWLDDSVTPEIRSALAATSSVLLLYRDIKNSGQPK